MVGILAGLALAAVIQGWLSPDGVLGRGLNRFAAFVATRLMRLRPLTAACFVLFVGALAALVALGDAEGLRLAAMAGPEGLAWFLALDIGTAVEAVGLAWFAASASGLCVVANAVRASRKVVRLRAMFRASRARAARPSRPAPLSDDDPGPQIFGGPVFA